MCECCINIKDLGCVASCSVIETGMVAALDGDYTIHWDWLGVHHYFTVPYLINDPIDFTSEWFNESAINVLFVKDPNGIILTLTILGIDYDCFSVRTVPTVAS